MKNIWHSVVSKTIFLLVGIWQMFVFSQAPDPLIESLKITKNRVDVIINQEFKNKYLLDDFFAEYDQDIDLTLLDESIVVMPFLMNIVSIVWISGKTYSIDSMDEELYISLEKIHEIFRRFYPKTSWLGKLVPKKLVKNSYAKSVFARENQDRVGLLFSGGVDSICSSLRNISAKQLLITVWGHREVPLDQDKLWLDFKKESIDFAQRYGHENAFIKSNYYYFLNTKILRKLSPEITHWRMDTVEGLGWAGLVAPILVLKGISSVLIGSTSFKWDFPHPMAASPLVDHNIVFADVHVKHDSFDFYRVDKCEYIDKFCKKNGLSGMVVRVCQHDSNRENCCHCTKCIRTIVCFLAAGANPKDFGFAIEDTFDVELSVGGLIKHLSLADKIELIGCQKKIRERLQEYVSVRTDLVNFLKFDIYPLMPNGHKQKLDWNNFKDLFEGIPAYLLK